MSTEVQVEGPFWILSLRDKLRAAGGIRRSWRIAFFFVRTDARCFQVPTRFQDLEEGTRISN